MPATIAVTVVYCALDAPWLVELRVASGANLQQAINQSGVLQKFPELAGGVVDAGIFGQRRALDTLLADGDRIEIYRPLKIDPMSARRLRAQARRQRE